MRIAFILLLLSFAAKAQINTSLLRLIPRDTTPTLPTWPSYAPYGFYYNVETGYITFKDALGYHKLTPGGGGGGGGGGTIVAVNGTTNEIDAAGTTTRTLSLSTTFKSAVGYVATPLSQFAATTSAQLRGVLSDEVGTGAFYTVGGALGTPASATGTNFTGIPLATGLSTFTSADLAGRLTNESGTGVVAYTTNTVFTTPNIGTPSAGVLTNTTGLPITGITSSTSAQLRTLLTDEVGTGAFYTVGGALGTPASATGTNFTGIPITGLTSSTSAQLATLLSDDVGTGALYFGEPTGANTSFVGSHTLALGDVGINRSGIVRITGSIPSTLTVPTNTTAAILIYSLIIVINESTDNITIAYASGVTPTGVGGTTIGPGGTATFYKTATNTWYTSVGGGEGISECHMSTGSFTTAKTLAFTDRSACNLGGLWTYTGSADVNLTVPIASSVAFEDGTNIAISNQSLFTITVILTGLTGGGHTYNTIAPGETGMIYFRSTNVVDLLGTRAPTEDLLASATLDFASTAAGGITDLTVTVTGAVVGDIVAIGASSIPNKGTYFGYVSATNTVTVRFANNDLTTAKDPSSQTMKVRVFK